MSESTLWGTTVTVEVSSAAPDADPLWVDITQWVLIADGQTVSTSLGRATELSSFEPGHFQLSLINNDDRFTVGNASSPYFPWWKQARRMRIRETVGERTFELADCFIEVPQNTAMIQTPDGALKYITMAVSGTDVIGRLRSGRKFVSTLGAQIVGNGGTALKAYWPLNEPSGPTVYTSAGGSWTLTQATHTSAFGFTANDPVYPSISYAAGTPAPGDDVSGIVFQPSRDNNFTPPVMIDSIGLRGDRPSVITLGSGQVMTLVAWIAADAYRHTVRVFRLNGAIDAIDADVAYVAFNDDGVIHVLATGDTWSGTATGIAFPLMTAPRAVAVRFGFSPAVIELWVDDKVYTGVMSVTTANPIAMRRMRVALPHDGSVAHLQVYLGTAADWDHDDFLAQREVGLYGLERQSTGQRINTILDYAGFPAARRDVDAGASVMQVAKLAGKTAEQALDEANDTERGRLFASAGRIQFHDRLRIYNV